MNPFQTFELIFLITQIKTKRGAEEPSLLLHNIITIFYISVFSTRKTCYRVLILKKCFLLPRGSNYLTVKYCKKIMKQFLLWLIGVNVLSVLGRP